MFSLTNAAVMRCCHDQPEVWSKSAYLSQYTKVADVVLGVLLCIVGALIAHGVIPMGGAAFFYGFGGAQIIIPIVMKCISCCTTIVNIVRSEGASDAWELISQATREQDQD